ncbi:RCC1/BLIP-II [Melanomma pulvis-pyrius CBS 109.77]|uniref:RCC1/BLIP-II n=1 Tax=Melanomma pulvis-pyrius CBS 109.77 TaxID=1314802 RepID=A0A6A6XWH4_9PLEO|nr:RCC1/BLIP-II [Melanomma pulvis-pyrius CBS 109.77]
MEETVHALYAFGSNTHCQLGLPHNNIDKVTTPTLAAYTIDKEGIISIQGGAKHTLIHDKNGRTVFGAGDNESAQLGTYFHVGLRSEIINYAMRSEQSTKTPLRYDTFEQLYKNIDFCAAGWKSTAYIVNRTASSPDGEDYAEVFTEGTCRWGELSRGQQVTPLSSTFETRLPGKVASFAAGTHHYVAVLENGDVYGWGKTRLGQLGDSTDPIISPMKIPSITPAYKVICGHDFTYIVGRRGSNGQRVMGRDKHGILNIPPDIRGWKDIQATWHAIFVLFENGKLIAWGKNDLWELVPPNLPPLDQIACGTEHILAVTKDGRLLAWGWGEDGNCGDLSAIPTLRPNIVSGCWNEISIPGKICKIGAGPNTSFVLTDVPRPTAPVGKLPTMFGLPTK